MRARRWFGAIVAAGAVLAATPVGSAGRGSGTELPTPTVSSDHVHLGDVVTISGTGCVDPDTGSTDGVVVWVVEVNTEGRPTTTGYQELPLTADGSYSGPMTVVQPVPDGLLHLLIECGRGRDFGPTVSTSLDITSTAPSLPDLVVTPGVVAAMTYPCPDSGNSFGIVLAGAPQVASSIEPSDGLGSPGQTMHLDVPPDLPLGTYPGSITCNTDVVSAHFNIRVIASGSTAGVPATPQPGHLSYTG